MKPSVSKSSSGRPTKPRAAPARRPTTARQRGSSALEGEGSYSATRDYNRHLQRDLKSRDVQKGAEKARRALEDTREAAELREAEQMGKRGPKTLR